MSMDLRVSQLRDPEQARAVSRAIGERFAGLGSVRLMEVCGTHTSVIRHSGIESLLPAGLELVSGPGCPVCVTPNRTLDLAIGLAGLDEVVLATFGDLIRVPGSRSSLSAERAQGADVRVVYSPLDALLMAAQEPDRQVVFLGVGFETTAPTVAAVVEQARDQAPNFSVLVAHKLVPPALLALGRRDDFCIQGFLLPGHVSAVIGSAAYAAVLAEAGVPGVVAGFEPLDVLLAIWMLLGQIEQGRAEVEVEYQSVVRPEGNRRAQAVLERVFEPVDSDWRGLGTIPASGLALRAAYRALDARDRFDLDLPEPVEPAECRCGQILVGALRPPECPLFGSRCTPAHPVGACMVSTEGSCAVYHAVGLAGPAATGGSR